MASCDPLPRLCLVTDSSVALHAPLEDVVAEAVAGGVGMVQVRQKTMASGELYRLANNLRFVTRSKALLIINDRVDLAIAVDADGVHLPTHSLPIDIAKGLCGEGMLLGRSVHSVEEAMAADEEGADYLILGTIYGTASHPGREASGPELIKSVKAQVSVPVYAIGGINASNVREVIGAGAHGIAVIRSILAAEDPRAAARELASIIESNC